MQLLSTIFLLGLCHDALAQNAPPRCKRESPPENPVLLGLFGVLPENGFPVINSGDVYVIWSPPSSGTTSGVVKLENKTTKTRWVRLIGDITVDLRVDPEEANGECKTNLVMKSLSGAYVFSRY